MPGWRFGWSIRARGCTVAFPRWRLGAVGRPSACMLPVEGVVLCSPRRRLRCWIGGWGLCSVGEFQVIRRPSRSYARRAVYCCLRSIRESALSRVSITLHTGQSPSRAAGDGQFEAGGPLAAVVNLGDEVAGLCEIGGNGLLLPSLAGVYLLVAWFPWLALLNWCVLLRFHRKPMVL